MVATVLAYIGIKITSGLHAVASPRAFDATHGTVALQPLVRPMRARGAMGLAVTSEGGLAEHGPGIRPGEVPQCPQGGAQLAFCSAKSTTVSFRVVFEARAHGQPT